MTTDRLKTTVMCSLTVLEARRPKSRYWQGHTLSKSVGELFHGFPLLLVSPAVSRSKLRDSSLCSHCHMALSLGVSSLLGGYDRLPCDLTLSYKCNNSFSE